MKLSASTFLGSCLLVCCLSLLAAAPASSVEENAEEPYLPFQAQETLPSPKNSDPASGETAPPGEEHAPPQASGAAESEPEEPRSPLETLRAITFPDVTPGTPEADCISYAAHLGLLQGIEDGLFGPEVLVTRAMAVTVLYRMSGEEAPPDQAFSDVSAEDWFAPAAAWAAKTGIATGYEDGTFRPNLPVTRSQLSALLYRMAVREDAADHAAVLEAYQDSGKLPDYAREPVAWALENRLFAGMVSDTIYPELSVTRGQMAQMLTALTAYREGDELAQAITDSLSAREYRFTDEIRTQLQAEVEATAKRYGAVGMQVAVIHNGAVMDSFATGWATQRTAPMTVDHKLRVASISKVDVALAAMALWDQGVVDLEESIGTYWNATMRNPYYKDTPVTIDAILSHTSSIGMFENASLRKAAVRSNLTSAGGYSYMKPGALSSYGYNNYAFGVLGMTLELAANKNLNQVMAPIFSVMGLDVSYFSGEIKASDLHTTLYQYGGSVGRDLATARGNVAPGSPGANGAFFAGGFTASAKDQAALVALLANDGKFQGVPLLSRRAVEYMESPLGYISDGEYYQCHPLRYQNGLYGRDKLYYHTGSAFGVYNFLSYDPDTGDGVVVLTSGASAARAGRGIYSVCGSIGSTVYDLLRDADSFAADTSAEGTA